MTATPGQALYEAIRDAFPEDDYIPWDGLTTDARARYGQVAAIAAQQPQPGPDACECGHAWAHHAFSDDVCAVAGCPCTRPRPAPQPAPELAAALIEGRALRALIAEILGTFSDASGDGYRARVGQVQIARWRERAGLTS